MSDKTSSNDLDKNMTLTFKVKLLYLSKIAITFVINGQIWTKTKLMTKVTSQILSNLFFIMNDFRHL